MSSVYSEGQVARFHKWKLDFYPYLLELSGEVLGRIVAEVRCAFDETSGGNQEVGGLLFGYGDGRLVRILAAISYPVAQGSDSHLGRFIRECESYPELSGMKLVGWFRSDSQHFLHTRPSDHEIHCRFFPSPWQVFLVLGPSDANPIGASVFVRPSRKVLLNPVLTVDDMIRSLRLRAAVTHQRERTPLRRAGEQPLSDQGIFDAFRGRLPGDAVALNGRKYVVAALIAATVGVVVFGYGLVPGEWLQRAWDLRHGAETAFNYVLRSEISWPRDLTIAPLSLEAFSSSSDVYLHWNSKAAALRSAETAVIELIRDGEIVERRLIGREQLKRGLYKVGPLTGQVTLRMTPHPTPDEPYSEAASFSGPARDSGVPAAANSSVGQNSRPVLAEQSGRRPGRERAGKGSQVANPGPSATPRRSAIEDDRQESPNTPRETAVVARHALLIEKGAADVPLRSAVLDSSQTPFPASRPNSQTGTLIWTGFVPQGQTLVIVGGNPSVGYLSGKLPGIPISVSISPGELSESGLTIYGDQDPSTEETAIEELVQRNTGTRVTYTKDADLARTFSLIDAPSERNRWMRLAIKATHRTMSALVIYWRALD